MVDFRSYPGLEVNAAKSCFPVRILAALRNEVKIEGAWNVPGPSDFERVKRIGVGDPV